MIACIHLHHFLVAVALRRQLQRHCRCIVVVDGEGARAPVIAASPQAAKEGVRLGMPAREVAALCPQGAVVAYDAAITEQATGDLLAVLERFSPTLEVMFPGTVACDLGGGATLPELEQEAKAMIAAVEPVLEMVASVGVACNRFVAAVEAQEARPGRVALVAPGTEKRILESRSIGYLPMEKETARRLEMLGILTLGQLSALPEAALVRQFGAEGAQLAALARGYDEVPVQGLPTPSRPSAAADFSWTIDNTEQLLAELERLVDQLLEEVQRQQQLCSSVKVTLLLEGGRRGALVVNFASPLADAKRIKRLLASRLETVDFPAPVVAASIQADGLVPIVARQLDMTSLFEATPQKRALQRVVEQCKAKNHRGAVMQVVWDDPANRIPERIAHLQDAVDDDHQRHLLVPAPVQVAVCERGYPRMVKVRSGWKAVDTVVESWDLDDEWWTPRPVMRAYHLVMLSNGAIFRVFLDRVNGAWYRQ